MRFTTLAACVLVLVASCATGGGEPASTDMGTNDLAQGDAADAALLPDAMAVSDDGVDASGIAGLGTDMMSVADAASEFDMSGAPDMSVDLGFIEVDAGPVLDASTGCTMASECDDRVVCTLDTCEGGACIHEANPTVCDDSNPCTVDSCSSGTRGGCRHLVLGAGALCDDGNECTTGDTCDGSLLAPLCIGADACPGCLCDPLVGVCSSCT